MYCLLDLSKAVLPVVMTEVPDEVHGPPTTGVEVSVAHTHGPLPTIAPAAMESHAGLAQLETSPSVMKLYGCGCPSGPVIVVWTIAPPQWLNDVPGPVSE